jgi:hypothetical protein
MNRKQLESIVYSKTVSDTFEMGVISDEKTAVRDSSSTAGIITYTRVAHGFRPNRNNRIFMPQELMDMIPTITYPFPVPVKPRHEVGSDPDAQEIGRVVAGSYIVTGSSSIGADDAQLINTLSADDPRAHAMINKYYKTVLKDENYKGLGFVYTKALVTDSDAIDDILKKRYLTVSIEANHTDVYDNISGKSWKQLLESSDEELPYYPGDMVDGVKALLVYSGLKMKGYAYTSSPADMFARDMAVEKLNEQQLQQQVRNIEEMMFAQDATVQEKNVSWYFSVINDSIQDNNKEAERNINICDNNNNEANQNNKGETMTAEEILKTVQDSTEVKDAVRAAYEAEFAEIKDAVAAKDSEIAVLKAEIQDTLKTLGSEKVKANLYKEQVDTFIQDAEIAKIALEKSVSDMSAIMDTVVDYVVTALTEVPTISSDMSLADKVAKVNEVFALQSADAVREKLFALGKESDGSEVKVTDATVAKDSDITKVEDSYTYTDKELHIAALYSNLVAQKQRGKAANFIQEKRRNKQISDNFNIDEAIAQAKAKNLI